MTRTYFKPTTVILFTLLTGCGAGQSVVASDHMVNNEIQTFLASQQHEHIAPAVQVQPQAEPSSEVSTQAKEINQQITSALLEALPAENIPPAPTQKTAKVSKVIKPTPASLVTETVEKSDDIPVMESEVTSQGNNPDEDGPPEADLSNANIGDATVKNEVRSRYGNPPTYYVLGKRYAVLGSGKGYHDRGIASWYGTKFHNKLTSSRETYDMFKMTAAHKTLPIPSYVRVTNLQNGKQIIVRVNDRGPFHENRIIDLSYIAAKKLEILGHGTGLVDVELVESDAPHAIALDHAPEIYLQIGAFSQQFNAQAHAKRLAKRFHQAVRVTQSTLNHRDIWRVQLGPIRNVEESDSLTHAVKLAGFGNALAVVR